jgi:DNA-binding winged helix-turn-helix (wHTH) protein/tetratricopeptide (TPR) repeat protein
VESVRLGDFRLLVARRELWRGAERARIGARALDVLIAIVRRGGELITKSELAREVWGTSAVEDAAIRAQIVAARRALGGGPESSTWLQTVPGRGVRFGQEILAVEDEPAADGKERPGLVSPVFENPADDPRLASLAAGLAVETAAAIASYRHLRVVSADGVEGARYALTGGVRRSGERVRVSVRLRDMISGRQIWSGRYEDELDNSFALEERIASLVAGVVPPAIETAEQKRLSGVPAEGLNGYQLYLRAHFTSLHIKKASALEAIALLERAVVLDPTFALAMSLAGVCHSMLVALGWADDPTHHRTAASRLVRRALELSRDDPEVLQYSAGTLFNLQEDSEAIRALVDRALALNPSLAAASMMSGFLNRRVGALEESVLHLDAAMRLDPLSPFRNITLTEVGLARVDQGRFAEAVAPLQEAVQISPNPILPHGLLAVCYGRLGRAAAERRCVERFEALSGQDYADWKRRSGYAEDAPALVMADRMALRQSDSQRQPA